MRTGDICNRDVVSINEDAGVLEAARVMRERHIGSLMVVNDVSRHPTKPVGIITDRDLVVEVLAEEIPMEAISVKDVMSDRLVLAREEDDLRDTLQCMRNAGVRRSPVVDADGFLVGIVSIDDLLSVLAEEFTDLVRLIQWERIQEIKTRTVA